MTGELVLTHLFYVQGVPACCRRRVKVRVLIVQHVIVQNPVLRSSFCKSNVSKLSVGEVV